MKIAPNRWWDWTAIVCFLAALITVAYRLSDTKWTENLNLVTSLTILAGAIGLLLGLSRFSPFVAGLLGLGYSILLIPWQLTEMVKGETLYWEKLSELADRFWISFKLFLNNQPLSDPVLFLTNMALLFWIVALVGGYGLTRHGKPWFSMIIAGLAILVIDIYHPAVGARGVAMAVYAVLVLVLVTRMYFLRRKRQWDNDDVTIDGDTGFTWGRGALITGIVLVVIAWNITSVVKAISPNAPEHYRAVRLWSELRTRFENAVKPLRGTTVVPREYFGDQFSLGTGSQLSDREIFRVEPNIKGRVGVPYYWRVRSYDLYRDGHWESTLDADRPRSLGNQQFPYSEKYNNRVTTTFKFYPARNLSMLYVPSMPLAINRSVTLIADTVDDELQDVTAVEIDPMLRAGEVYEAVSLIASPTIAQLRGARAEYPEWTDKYLQLPEGLPISISELALEITQGLDNPYDKTAAITSWMRENIKYNQILPSVPQGEDPIEWMLFTQKEAFCNYYATAQVLMLRSLGIPSRWVVGYAQGIYDLDIKAYRVRERDSHAWPEVFFPGFGWVEFEPTASLDVITRPTGGTNNSQGGLVPDPSAQIDEGPVRDQSVEDDPNADRFDTRSTNGPTIWDTMRIAAIVGATLFIPLFAILMFRMGRRNSQYILPVVIEKSLRKRGWKVPGWVGNWSSYVGLTTMEKVFIQVEWMLDLLKLKIAVNATPSEQIRQLISTVPDGEIAAKMLLEEYQKDIYSSTPGDIDTARAAIQDLWIRSTKHGLHEIGDWITTGKKPFSSSHPPMIN